MKLFACLTTLAILAGAIHCAHGQDAMTSQESFIKDFFKDNDSSNSRIKSKATPDSKNSDGFIRQYNPPKSSPPATKTVKPEREYNPWTGHTIKKKPASPDILPDNKSPQEKQKLKKEPSKSKSKRTGSGFFISASGYFVTNYHVTLNDEDIWIKTVHGKFPATTVIQDKKNDLVILKVQSEKSFTPMSISSNSNISSGTDVFTIGFPLPSLQGFQPKVSRGIISSTSGLHDDPRHFQISVQVQPGNSGGVLANMSGQVVGVIRSTLKSSVIYSKTGVMPQNVNYAIKNYLLVDLIKKANLKEFVTFTSETKQDYNFANIIKMCTNSVGMVMIY